MGDKTVRGFADDEYCTINKRNKTVCGIVDGPWGMTVFNDTLYVSVFGADQVMLFSLSSHNFGKFIDSFGDSESLDCPEGLAVDRQHQSIYIANYNSNNIVQFDLKTHQFLREFISASTSFGYLKGPESIVYDPYSKLFAITSFSNNSVLFFSVQGALVKVIGGYSDGNHDNKNFLSVTPGDLLSKKITPNVPEYYHLSGPTGIALTPHGTFAVTLYKVNPICN